MQAAIPAYPLWNRLDLLNKLACWLVFRVSLMLIARIDSTLIFHGTVISYAVPKPVVTPILGDNGLVPIQSSDDFILSFLIGVDPTVDIPVDVEATWKGHPSLLDKPRVTVQPTPSNPPYLTSLVFDSIKPRDFGDYGLSVVLGVSSREGVISSDAVDVSMVLSLGNNTIIICTCSNDIYTSSILQISVYNWERRRLRVHYK